MVIGGIGEKENYWNILREGKPSGYDICLNSNIIEKKERENRKRQRITIIDNIKWGNSYEEMRPAWNRAK